MRRELGTEALALVAPFALWGLAFALLYAGHGLACGVGVRPGNHDGLTRLLLALLLLVFLGLHAWLAWLFLRRWRRGSEGAVGFIRLAAWVLGVAAFATTVWTGAPVLFLTICS
ncbi:MAG TPA: hypothetical protein VM265_10450 [Sphingomicrobium sp.]|nr:hypothetical protein [Sphingomicrobium sp.]